MNALRILVEHWFKVLSANLLANFYFPNTANTTQFHYHFILDTFQIRDIWVLRGLKICNESYEYIFLRTFTIVMKREANKTHAYTNKQKERPVQGEETWDRF